MYVSSWYNQVSLSLLGENFQQLRIQVEELLFDDTYLSKVIEEMKSWFTRMKVLDLI